MTDLHLFLLAGAGSSIAMLWWDPDSVTAWGLIGTAFSCTFVAFSVMG